MFEYADWAGLTMADFPLAWLLFTMGMCIPLSHEKVEKRAFARRNIFSKVLRRTAILLILGLLMNNGSDLSHWRLSGPLQRAAVAYFCCYSLVLYVRKRGPHVADEQDEDVGETQVLLRPVFFKSPLKDLIPYWRQWLVIALIIFIHEIIADYLPVPDCPTGYVGPGGISEDSQYVGCTGGAAGYIDRLILGDNHVSPTPTCLDEYNCQPFDSSNLLGYLTCIVTCYIGVQAGRILCSFRTPDSRLRRWVFWGMSLSLLGILMTEARVNDGWIPINRNLWSLSFVCVTAGGAFIVQIVIHIIVDCVNMWGGAPFKYVGRNTLLIFVAQEVFKNYFPFSFYTTETISSHSLLLTSNLVGLTAWVTIAYLMHCNSFYVKI